MADSRGWADRFSTGGLHLLRDENGEIDLGWLRGALTDELDCLNAAKVRLIVNASERVVAVLVWELDSANSMVVPWPITEPWVQYVIANKRIVFPTGGASFSGEAIEMAFSDRTRFSVPLGAALDAALGTQLTEAEALMDACRDGQSTWSP